MVHPERWPAWNAAECADVLEFLDAVQPSPDLPDDRFESAQQLILVAANRSFAHGDFSDVVWPGDALDECANLLHFINSIEPREACDIFDRGHTQAGFGHVLRWTEDRLRSMQSFELSHDEALGLLTSYGISN